MLVEIGASLGSLALVGAGVLVKRVVTIYVQPSPAAGVEQRKMWVHDLKALLDSLPVAKRAKMSLIKKASVIRPGGPWIDLSSELDAVCKTRDSMKNGAYKALESS